MAEIFCYSEAATFPDSEFRRDQDGKLHVPYIHETGSPHYRTGEPLSPGTNPVLLRVRDLAAELHGLALTMSADDLRDLIDHVRTEYKA